MWGSPRRAEDWVACADPGSGWTSTGIPVNGQKPRGGLSLAYLISSCSGTPALPSVACRPNPSWSREALQKGAQIINVQRTSSQAEHMCNQHLAQGAIGPALRHHPQATFQSTLGPLSLATEVIQRALGEKTCKVLLPDLLGK